MGIKDLHKILGEHANECYKVKHLSEYSFKKIAIDISLYLYKYKAICGDNWLEAFISLINCLRKWDIHCFFVYDGVAPVEKIEEQRKRREKSSNQKKRIEFLEQEILKYEETGEAGEIMKKICSEQQKISLFRKKESVNINIDLVKEKLNTLKSYVISITKEDIEQTKELFDILNVPYITASGEAEAYSSFLCNFGKVDCVLSEDTDVIAYGATVFLTKIDIYKNTVTEMVYTDIIETLGLTKESFLDLCIMCGCDYNSNIRDYGYKKSFLLIKNFHSIENSIEEIKKKSIKSDFSVLNYEKCRELFKNYGNIQVNNAIDTIPYCGVPDFGRLESFFLKNRIVFNIETIRKNTNPREILFEDEV